MHNRMSEAMTKQEMSNPVYTPCLERIMHHMKPISHMKPSSLKAERELRGWSQSKIAELLGTTTKTVGRWERGEAVPYPHYREQLCTLFGKNAQQLGWLQEEEEQVLPMAKLKEIDTDRLSSALTEPWLLQDPTLPQTLGKTSQLLGRYDLFMQIKERLLMTDNRTATTLMGLVGVGKTTLAAALATNQQIQDYFVDGILWAGLGPSGNVLSQLIRWGKLLGVTPAQVGNIKSPQSWCQALQAVIGTRRLLLIIDDAWTAEDALALQVGGPCCAHLLTTHRSQVASAFAPQELIVVPPLEDADGLALLACFIPQLVKQDPEGARKLVRALESVPLALTLMGKYLASRTLIGQSRSLQATLAQLYEIQEGLQVTMSGASREQSSGLIETRPLYLYAAMAICDQYLSPQAHAALCTLSIFASKPESFSKEVALEVSKQSIETLDELLDVGLLQNWGPDRYTLHQIVADYVCIQSEALGAYRQLSTSPIEQVQVRHYHHSHPFRKHFHPLLSLQNGGISHTSKKSMFWTHAHIRFSLLPLLTLSITLLVSFAVIAFLLAYTGLPSSSSIKQVPNNLRVQPPTGTNYEAEAKENTLVGGIIIHKCSRCSDKYKVGYIGTRGILQFNAISAKSTGDYRLTIYYIDGSGARTLQIKVNGGSTKILHMSNSGGWHEVRSFSTMVSLNAGYNTIKFFNPSAYAPDIDRIVV